MEGKDIRKLRAKLGLTQKELAAILKVDAVTVSRWERKSHRPKSKTNQQLERLSQNVTI